jgi:hypothetical protein
MSKPVRLRRNSKIKKRVLRRFRLRPTVSRRVSKKEKTLELRFIEDRQEAKERIKKFIQVRPGSRTSEIIEGLRIDPVQATEILNELKQEDVVLSRPIGG